MNKKAGDKHRNMFLILAVGPIIAMIVLITILLSVAQHKVEQKYNLDISDEKSSFSLFDKALLLSSYTKDDFTEIQEYARDNPDRLADMKKLKEFDLALKDKFSFLVVQKDSEYIYFGNARYKTILKDRLSQGVTSLSSGSATYLEDEKEPLLVKDLSFRSDDGSCYSVHIITKMNIVLPHVKALNYLLFTAIMVVIIVISVVIVGYAYYHVVKPIRGLQKAAIAIREGDLDVAIDSSKQDDEFAGLYSDFEKMRVRLKDSLEEQTRTDTLTREVIGNISHDLKTPLTAIKGYAEGILDGVATTPERLEKYVRTIYVKASDMAGLVDELAYFTKINQKDVLYNYTYVQAGRYFSDCISELSLDLETKNINLVFQSEISDDVLIRIDVEKIKRVVNNIIGNAAKYIRHNQGIILVKLLDEDDSIVVRMEDNGAGINKEELPHIFDRFYRTDSSRRSTTGGSGLGLAITKKIIEDHGGTIWAESEESVGTAILFKLDKVKGIQTKEDI